MRIYCPERKLKGLEAEIESIAGMLVASGHLSARERLQLWRNGSFWRRVLTVPKPLSLWEWVSTSLFYIYFWAAVIYFIVTIIVLFLVPIDDIGFDAVILFILGLYWLIVCLVMRHWRLTLSKKDTQSV